MDTIRIWLLESATERLDSILKGEELDDVKQAFNDVMKDLDERSFRTLAEIAVGLARVQAMKWRDIPTPSQAGAAGGEGGR